jgi:hypothetical protein
MTIPANGAANNIFGFWQRKMVLLFAASLGFRLAVVHPSFSPSHLFSKKIPLLHSRLVRPEAHLLHLLHESTDMAPKAQILLNSAPYGQDYVLNTDLLCYN